ncbi:MAG: uroporphyrinogen decarboxylase [Candidatus Aerophobus sp.]|nr:MAG: uroporphyrinogen decarboxylase [Candidatus Aerophobus sp.]
MSKRERVVTALNHREPDRVPKDCSGVAGMTDKTYKRFVDFLGIKDDKSEFNQEWRIVNRFDKRALEALGVDTINVFLREPRGYKPKVNPDGTITNEWGIIKKNVGSYIEIVGHPLSSAEVKDIYRYPWPDPCAPGRTDGLREEVERLYNETDYAIKAAAPMNSFLEFSQWLRGFEQFLVDLILNEDFVNVLLDRELELQKGFYEVLLDAVGDYIQIVETSDDLGAQQGPLISLETYRKFIKPRQKEINDFIHGRTDAKIFQHSDGSVYQLIPDLIETGLDILEPVQPLAKNMEPQRLKKEFGDRLCFWGGIDIQSVLPKASVEEVENHVRSRIRALAPGGGYVVSPAHNIQEDTPCENILALYRAVDRFGQYPIDI